MTTRPERAHVLAFKASGDTRKALEAELRHLLFLLSSDQLSVGVSGGPDAGSIYAYRHDPSQTHDGYFSAIDALMQEQKDTKP